MTTKAQHTRKRATTDASEWVYMDGVPAMQAHEYAKEIVHTWNTYPDLLALAEAVAAHFEGTDSPLGIQARVAIAKDRQGERRIA